MYVYKDPQRQWLAAAEQELGQRIQERDTINRRIAELEHIINTLRPIVGASEEMTEQSLSNLCLRVVGISGAMYQSAPQIRDGLKAWGIEIAGKNPMGVIHTTLGRLAESRLIEARSPRPGAPLQFRITTAGRLALQNL